MWTSTAPATPGIRTDDALLRFYDRGLLDPPVAVGHDYYGDQHSEAKLQGGVGGVADRHLHHLTARRAADGGSAA